MISKLSDSIPISIVIFETHLQNGRAIRQSERSPMMHISSYAHCPLRAHYEVSQVVDSSATSTSPISHNVPQDLYADNYLTIGTGVHEEIDDAIERVPYRVVDSHVVVEFDGLHGECDSVIYSDQLMTKVVTVIDHKTVEQRTFVKHQIYPPYGYIRQLLLYRYGLATKYGQAPEEIRMFLRFIFRSDPVYDWRDKTAIFDDKYKNEHPWLIYYPNNDRFVIYFDVDQYLNKNPLLKKEVLDIFHQDLEDLQNNVYRQNSSSECRWCPFFHNPDVGCHPQ